MKTTLLGCLVCTLLSLVPGRAGAQQLDQVAPGARLMLMGEMAMPAHQAFASLFEVDLENGDEAPRRLACRLHHPRSATGRSLQGGDEFLVSAVGRSADRPVPGQQATQWAYLRLTRIGGEQDTFELRVHDSGDANGEPDFSLAQWEKRCGVWITDGRPR
ncbi:hypothetical protein [Pseudomarimonas salicorniae]|uniref:Uncharacterized protein n=1 Tax=Pseudomarimonas salicorniae TaxID=2933270 RepID=A0ABT0GD31_9GAMM|nr:hypothetical protein [Lysobacter sp. CAU 1642]MCK7592441.1 hypothetical protein [Lysobacter sp. CAU 1642]